MKSAELVSCTIDNIYGCTGTNWIMRIVMDHVTLLGRSLISRTKFFIYLVASIVVFYRAYVKFPDYFLVAATIHTSLVSF